MHVLRKILQRTFASSFYFSPNEQATYFVKCRLKNHGWTLKKSIQSHTGPFTPMPLWLCHGFQVLWVHKHYVLLKCCSRTSRKGFRATSHDKQTACLHLLRHWNYLAIVSSCCRRFFNMTVRFSSMHSLCPCKLSEASNSFPSLGCKKFGFTVAVIHRLINIRNWHVMMTSLNAHLLKFLVARYLYIDILAWVKLDLYCIFLLDRLHKYSCVALVNVLIHSLLRSCRSSDMWILFRFLDPSLV